MDRITSGQTDIDHASRVVLSYAATTVVPADQTYLLAERVLSANHPEARTSPLSMIELAEVAPNGELIAEQISKVHHAHSIEGRIRPRVAAAVVTLLAGATLDLIRRETKVAAAHEQIKTPAILDRDLCITGLKQRARERIHRRGTIALQGYLEATPTVLERVRKAVDWSARQARERAAASVRQVAADYHADRSRSRAPLQLKDMQRAFDELLADQERSMRYRISEADQG